MWMPEFLLVCSCFCGCSSDVPCALVWLSPFAMALARSLERAKRLVFADFSSLTFIRRPLFADLYSLS